MKHKYNDGGREEAGYKGKAGDCVVRAIAIALKIPYEEVYTDLKKLSADKKRRATKKKYNTPRNGVHMNVSKEYLLNKGWGWKSTMGIGTGCRVHLCEEELPKGRIIVRLSRHFCCVINGVINDTYDPSRGGNRCVYGYFYKLKI